MSATLIMKRDELSSHTSCLFFLQVQDLLVSGVISAYIDDLPLIQRFIQESGSACTLMLLGDDGTQGSTASIDPFNYAYAFDAEFSDELLAQFNIGLVTIQVNHTGFKGIIIMLDAVTCSIILREC